MALLEIGADAPAFEATDHSGRTVRLEDYRGKTLVMWFYPKADTPGCTRQACAVRDAWTQIDARGATVLGISPDQPPALVKFREKYDLPFPLLSDPDHAVAEAYGAWGEKKRGDKVSYGIIRSHFAVDEAGKLAELKLQVKPETTVELALRLIEVG